MIKQLTVIVLSTFLLSILSACGNEISSLADTVDPTQQTQYIETDQEEKAINEPVKKMISTTFSGSDEDQDVENTLNGEEKVAVDNKTLVVYFSCTGTTESLAEYAAGILGADLYEIVPEKQYTKADLAYYTGGRADQEQNNPYVRPAILGSVENMFCTSHSSGIGASADNLHSLCADSTEWKAGRRFGSDTSKETMEEWLNGTSQ